MAEIAAFRGVFYRTDRVDASSVLAPPYDVIDEEGRRKLEARSPKNCVRLILPQGEGKYEAAAETLRSWLGDGTLARDDRPALYRYHQVFRSAELDQREVVRKGFIAAVRLHRFDERVILPHERTLKGPKLDRLQLMRATGAHFSQIFTLYDDPAAVIDAAFAPAEARAPLLDGSTEDGTRHLLWRVDDPAVIAMVQGQLADKQLYIADGHHRYETMVTLRDELAARTPGMRATRARIRDAVSVQHGGPGADCVADSPPGAFGGRVFADGTAAQSRGVFLGAAAARNCRGGARGARGALAEAGKKSPSFLAAFPGNKQATLFSLHANFDPRKAGLLGADGGRAPGRDAVAQFDTRADFGRRPGRARSADQSDVLQGYAEGAGRPWPAAKPRSASS